MGAHNGEGLPPKEGIGNFHMLAGEAGFGVEVVFSINPPEGSILCHSFMAFRSRESISFRAVLVIWDIWK